VPLEGIAVGRILRFENELRTVLERWTRERKDKDDARLTPSSSLLFSILEDQTAAAAFRKFATERHVRSRLTRQFIMCS